MPITCDRARQILQQASSRNILVTGDLMLDRYVEGTVHRISPEAPVPVVHVRRDREVPGGACNVALNIRSLGARATICGVAGTDAHGDRLLALLQSSGVDVSPVVRSPDMETIVKTRVVADRQQVVRVDREGTGYGDIVLTPNFASALETALGGADGMIIEDYGKGVVQQSVVNRMLEEARRRNLPSGYDPKDNRELDVRGVTLATPNRREAFHAAGIEDIPGKTHEDDLERVRRMGCQLYARWQPSLLMLTLGPLGIMLISKGCEIHRANTRAREVFDVSGAGDTVIAACLLALAGGASPIEAAELGNFAAGVVVAKLGTATCMPDELYAAIRDADV